MEDYLEISAFSTPQTVEITEMFDRVSRHQGVIGVMVFNSVGVAIKSTLDHEQTRVWSAMVSEMFSKTLDYSKTFGEGVSMKQLRIHSTNYDVIIALEKDHVLVAIHKQVNERESEIDVNE